MQLMSALVVDDDLDYLLLLKEIFSLLDFDTAIASSPGECLEIASQKVFDCVYVNYKMPGIDGRSLCMLLRQIRGYQDRPIILFTAHKEDEFLEEDIDEPEVYGADYVVTKATSLTEFRQLKALAENHRGQGWQASERTLLTLIN